MHRAAKGSTLDCLDLLKDLPSPVFQVFRMCSLQAWVTRDQSVRYRHGKDFQQLIVLKIKETKFKMNLDMEEFAIISVATKTNF